MVALLLAPLALHALLAPTARAFLAVSPSTLEGARSVASYPALRAGNEEWDGEEILGREGPSNGCSRRELLRSASLAGAASLLAAPSSARAAATTASVAAKGKPATLVSNALCDPSVSTWVKNYGDDTTRTVHILGTAHISQSSAELAGRLVREVQPNVVFVELDAKRVARAIPGGINGSGGGGAEPTASNGQGTSSGASGSGATLAMESDGSPDKDDARPTARSAITSTPNVSADGASGSSNPFDVQSKLVNVGSKYVGNSVKGMYSKLESEGFKAGDEFAMSVREGLVIGSTIVLGDRDVEVTLRRLTKALTKTDIRKLLSADSEINSSMEELLPENMKAALKSPNAGGGGGNSMTVSSMGMDGVQIDKGEFNEFVETMKAKDNVKKVMQVLKKTAPEIYEAMVGERDVYMAKGLDELGDTVKGSSVDDTVAVMGMAHVDGVEMYLASRGWKELTYPCPVVR